MTPEQREKRRAYQREYAARRRREMPEHVRAIYMRSKAKHLEKRRADSRLRSRVRSGIVDATDEARVGRCALCPFVGALVCDHDKQTGDIRGWLCTPCNTALGRLGDNEAGLTAALAYGRGKGR